ncbi:MAG: DNA mismatch repair protein MutL, partial [Bacteroidetes bacterium 4572_112]
MKYRWDLHDSVANQIAAGEVIQRPASAVKELIENAIDAGATDIKLIIKDAGKSLIQVIDNGSGMSPTDARMSFERHATSKIKEAADLFAIQTMGFRGEALASIAAIAQVELRTKRSEDEIGTQIDIEGSLVKNQTEVVCNTGTIFSIKNLYFNTPARRNFLKSNQAEIRHIQEVFVRTALVNPQLRFSFFEEQRQKFDLRITHW